jgi:hypothetical protein
VGYLSGLSQVMLETRMCGLVSVAIRTFDGTDTGLVLVQRKHVGNGYCPEATLVRRCWNAKQESYFEVLLRRKVLVGLFIVGY